MKEANDGCYPTEAKTVEFPWYMKAKWKIRDVIAEIKHKHFESYAVPVKEEDGVHEKWYAEAKTITLDNLADFVRRLGGGYDHDYGTIVHAITASAVAAAHAVDRGPQGGITGFQAGAVFWEFARRWFHIEGPARLLQYDDMLFPQYADRFDKNITSATWAHIQEKARKMLLDNNGGYGASEIVKAHCQSIVDGKVPFGYVVKEG